METIKSFPFDVPLAAATKLSAGKLTCLLEEGNLRYIKIDGEEIVRMVYAALRDESWNTATVKISNETIEEHIDGFEVKYDVAYFFGDENIFNAFILIEGRSDKLYFSFEGEAPKEFRTNRAGFCMHLHIENCKGKEVIVQEKTGLEKTYHFPDNISPHQPFSNISKLQWLTEGWKINMECEGEIFEMEDQRNWLDHSYKLYGRPLNLPFPYLLKAGEIVKQSITISFEEKQTSSIKINQQTIAAEQTSLPKLGVMYESGSEIPPWAKSVRIEIYFDEDWESVFDEICLSKKEVSLVCFFSDLYLAEADSLIKKIKASALDALSVLPLHKNFKTTTSALLSELYPVFKEQIPSIQIGYGTDCYFAELNRQWPSGVPHDFVSFSINPQVHATDTRSLIENLGTINDLVNTISTNSNKPFFVTPITFKKRKNHDGPAWQQHHKLNYHDPREETYFGALWVLLAICHFHKAAAVHLFNPGKETPLYKLLVDLVAFGAEKCMLQHRSVEFFNAKKNEMIAYTLPAAFFVE